MRTLFIITAFFWISGLFSQNVDSLGIDDNPFLNSIEVELLNFLLTETRDTFDFSNKKVAFLRGSSGGTIISKSYYFENAVKPWIENHSDPQIFMVRLTEDEKIESGGYDVLVLSWVKIFTPKTKEKVILEL